MSWISSACYRFAERLTRLLPRRWALAFAVLAARVTYALRLPPRRALERHLSLWLGDRSAARHATLRAHEHFAHGLLEFLTLERMSPERLAASVEIVGGHHLEAARRSGRGVILLSAHLGNWEWGAAALAALGHPLHIAARTHRSRAVEALFERRRTAFGLRRLPERGRWVTAARLLRSCEWVALMADRDLPARRDRVCAWAAALARRTGAVILPAVTLRRGQGRHVLIFEPPLSPGACAAGGYRRAILPHLLSHPEQWCGFDPSPGALA